MEELKLKIEEEAIKSNYTKEEIKDIERSVLLREKGIGLESTYIENEHETRKEKYYELLGIVQSKLNSDEEILVSKINVPYEGGTGAKSVCKYYQGLFFTNKRIFIFNMNFKYEELEKLEIKDIQDIANLKDLENLNGIRIEFKNKDRIFLKSYSQDEKKITLIVVKHLLDSGVKFL